MGGGPQTWAPRLDDARAGLRAGGARVELCTLALGAERESPQKADTGTGKAPAQLFKKPTWLQDTAPLPGS